VSESPLAFVAEVKAVVNSVRLDQLKNVTVETLTPSKMAHSSLAQINADAAENATHGYAGKMGTS